MSTGKKGQIRYRKNICARTVNKRYYENEYTRRNGLRSQGGGRIIANFKVLHLVAIYDVLLFASSVSDLDPYSIYFLDPDQHSHFRLDSDPQKKNADPKKYLTNPKRCKVYNCKDRKYLPLVMIWLGSKESSVSCSPTHAYKVRTCERMKIKLDFCWPAGVNMAAPPPKKKLHLPLSWEMPKSS